MPGIGVRTWPRGPCRVGGPLVAGFGICWNDQAHAIAAWFSISWPGVNGPMSGRPFGFGAGTRGVVGTAGGNCTGFGPGSGFGAGRRGVGRSRRVGFGFGFVRRAGRVRRFGCGFGLAPLAIHNVAGSSDGGPICGKPGTEGITSGGATTGGTYGVSGPAGTRGVDTWSPGGSGVGCNSGRGVGQGFGGRSGCRSRGSHGSRMNGRPRMPIPAHQRRLRMLAM